MDNESNGDTSQSKRRTGNKMVANMAAWTFQWP
jgi:hypothetical protein